MVEITEEGYQSIRDHVENGGGDNWEWIELRDDDGDPIFRVDETNDTRVTWTHDAGAQVLELEIVVQGSDDDVTAPQTFGESALFDVETDGSPYSVETFDNFTIEDDEDQLTVRHQIEVPQL